MEKNQRQSFEANNEWLDEIILDYAHIILQIHRKKRTKKFRTS